MSILVKVLWKLSKTEKEEHGRIKGETELSMGGLGSMDPGEFGYGSGQCQVVQR